MTNEFKALIEAAKEYKEYQSIGNGAKLNCAIEAAELALQQPDVSGSLQEHKEVIRELMNTYIINLNEDGEPKASITDIMNLRIFIFKVSI